MTAENTTPAVDPETALDPDVRESWGRAIETARGLEAEWQKEGPRGFSQGTRDLAFRLLFLETLAALLGKGGSE